MGVEAPSDDSSAALILAPSDVLRTPKLELPRKVGGRVLVLTPQGFELADAFGKISVHWDAAGVPQGLDVGALLVVQGLWDGRQLNAARLIDQQPKPEPKGDGEFARLLWAGVGRRLQQRARACAFVREYFARQAFLEVDTPQRVRSPGLDVHLDALPSRDAWLITSPEYHLKRLLAGGVPRLFQLGHCFRADEQGPWHEAEFAMLEWYRAFADVAEVMADTEHLVRGVVSTLSGQTQLQVGGLRVDVAAPFVRLTVSEAFRRFADGADALALADTDPSQFFELLVSRVEPALSRFETPVFLHAYPPSQASLAAIHPGPPPVAERFELYVAGVELCNGFQELTDASEQRARLERDQRARVHAGKTPYPIDERFLAALHEGLPRAAGNALGLDRLIALSCGAASIAEVQPFPADRV